MSWLNTIQLGFVILAGFGVSLLTAVGIAYRARRRPHNALSVTLRIIGLLCVAAGLFGPLLMAVGDSLRSASPWAAAGLLYFTFPILIFAVTMLGQLRRAKLRTLLLCVAAAEERQLPIPLAVRALAWEQINRFGNTCRRFADRVESGIAISDAFPLKDAESFVALEVGAAQHRLSDSIRESLRQPIRDISLLRFCYGAMILATALSIIGFITVSIAPIFDRILFEFGQTSQLGGTLQPLGAPFAVLNLAAILVAIALAIHQFGFTGQNLPLINRLSLTADAGRVLRSLAGAVAAQQPVEQTLELLATRYPKTIVRVRLALALGGHRAGRHWLDTLTTARLITPAETAVLKSAERTENLGWALSEMAQRKSRRVESMWILLNTAAIPLFTLLLGFIVAIVAVGTFSDLYHLVEALR